MKQIILAVLIGIGFYVYEPGPHALCCDTAEQTAKADQVCISTPDGDACVPWQGRA
ncbi:MAG: hypothetical protein VXY73_11505 [Pseudomonadota bacterium]|jgi:hypothetical protein|nr:hypothetical protein [Pseudomonadota bacterium]MEC8795738.1 hypothetical protein [Pseudomonadota bacterium]